jgi:hypothetical protein
MIRPLESFFFKGANINQSVENSLLKLEEISNLTGQINIFDSSKPFQSNRVSLISTKAIPYILFEDIKINFTDLDTKLVPPSQVNCASSDAQGNCLKCEKGYFFSDDFSSCDKCTNLYVPLLNQCTTKYKTQVFNGNKRVDEDTLLKFKIYDTNYIPETISYFSFFNKIPESVNNTFKSSFPATINEDYIIKFNLQISINNNQLMNDVLLPSKFYIKHSGIDHLFMNIVDIVSKPSPKEVHYEMYIPFHNSPSPQSSNYLIPLRKKADSDILKLQEVENITFFILDMQYDEMIKDRLDSKNQMLPIEVKTNSFSIRPLGLFHNWGNKDLNFEEGFYVHGDQENGIFLSFPCNVGCSTCDINSSCLSCKKGYFFSDSESTCLECSHECLTCVNHPEKCIKCRESSLDISQSKIL